MPESLLLLLAVVADLVGMGWLALAMEPHWRQVRGGSAPAAAPAKRLRLLGSLALISSLALCLAVDHPTMAALVWVMALAAASLAIAFVLSWRARWLRVLLLSRPGRERGSSARPADSSAQAR